jgi:ABC-type polysaccharide/polyol phosphate transport system ATPase subunit
MTNPTIQVQQVSKRYRIGKGTSLVSLLADLGKRNGQADQYHWAVKNVSFELQPGEALGIIGPNGAGKTTLLKILSHVTAPTSGAVKLNGRFSALIELGAGFHQDLTGRENIYLNGTILGMRRSEINARFDQIVEFAGIGNFLDTPVKRYSSGMYARLGFAIAAHIDPQILLVDEVLAVGDYAFQLKCYARMKELRAKGTSLIFVSHNLEAVREVCDRGLVMFRGEAIFQGTAAEAVVAYSDAIRQSAREAKMTAPMEDGLSQRVMTFDAEIKRVRLLDAAGQSISMLQSGDYARVVLDVCFHQDVAEPIFSLNIRTPSGQLVYDTTTKWLGVATGSFKANEQCQVEFAMKMPLLDGEYQLDIDIADAMFSHFYDRIEGAVSFWVKDDNSAKGLVDLKACATITRLGIGEEQHELAKS